MRIYKLFEHLSYWFRYQATYYEMEYHLKQILKGKYKTYYKKIGHYDRAIGKSVALARLSAKYKIPIVVSTQSRRREIEINIPEYLPKYFSPTKRPTVIVANENFVGKRHKILLLEEDLSEDCWTRILPITERFIGYMNL